MSLKSFLGKSKLPIMQIKIDIFLLGQKHDKSETNLPLIIKSFDIMNLKNFMTLMLLSFK